MYAARDRASHAAVREDEELPDTPATAASLAAMITVGGGSAVASSSSCGTVVREERSFREEEEEEEEEESFLGRGCSGGSAEAEVNSMWACDPGRL